VREAKYTAWNIETLDADQEKRRYFLLFAGDGLPSCLYAVTVTRWRMLSGLRKRLEAGKNRAKKG
jgi:hypothetical protein